MLGFLIGLVFQIVFVASVVLVAAHWEIINSVVEWIPKIRSYVSWEVIQKIIQIASQLYEAAPKIIPRLTKLIPIIVSSLKT